MIRSDEENLELIKSTESVDEINAKFYGRFQYPWAPMVFNSLTDPYFETLMLNQSIGSWDHRVVPKNAKIWVAGCGTNQAVFTALRFPKSNVLGSDLSAKSLETCAQTAKQLGIANLELRKESINKVMYQETFDHIICTGVIHHNAEPKVALDKLANALKPSGLLELMVYNRYHRIETTAFQKAVRTLGASTTGVNFESEMMIAKKIIHESKMENNMTQFLRKHTDLPESQTADALLQPVEYSFTVESLEALATSCGLEFVAPCINQFDKAEGTFFWNMEFDDPDLQDRYDSLPDSRRWQVSNLLMLEKSPMLWFYLQRKDADRERKSEKQLCEEFLNLRFTKANTEMRAYVRDKDGKYKLSSRSIPYPDARYPDTLCRQIMKLVVGQAPVRTGDIFQQLGIDTRFQAVNKLRLYLTTNAFPYLLTVA